MSGSLETTFANRRIFGFLRRGPARVIGWVTPQELFHHKRDRNDEFHNAAPVAPKALCHHLQNDERDQKCDHGAHDRIHAKVDTGPIGAKDGPLENIDDVCASPNAHDLHILPVNRGPHRPIHIGTQ